ncbi:MAG: S1C family serine protease [Acidimicrobiales bacterium]
MEPEDRPEEDAPLFPWLPPDDRLWRHPSELAGNASPDGPYRTQGPDPRHPDAAANNDAADPRPTVGNRGRGTAARQGRSRSRRLSPATISTTSSATGGTGTVTDLRDGDRRLWTVAVLAGVVGALVATSAVVVVGQLGRPTTVIRPIEQVVAPNNPAVTLTTDPIGGNIGPITTRLRPTIVELIVNNDGSNVIGSGVVFSSNGYILTDDHLVHGVESMVAVLANGQRVDARLIGGDQATDIAVVQLKGGKPEAVATLGSSSDLEVGQQAIALGSPGDLASGVAVTSGIISALNSEVYPAEGPQLRDMIQTDAAVDPGCNGGALVDSNGMVVGITTSVTIGDQGMHTLSFATPIEIARDVANQLLQTGRVVHAWLGIDGDDVDVSTAAMLNVSGGAVVNSVDAGSPAAKAGIVASDVITSLADNPVQSMSDLDAIVRAHHPGDRVTMTYLRDGNLRSASLVLLQQPTS